MSSDDTLLLNLFNATIVKCVDKIPPVILFYTCFSTLYALLDQNKFMWNPPSNIMLIYTFSKIQFFTLQFSEFVESFIILHNQQSIRAPTTELWKNS